MAQVKQGRWTAEFDGDFVVFLIGACSNNFFHLLRSFGDLGGRRGMNHMLKYLTEHPEKGLLGYENGFPTIVQYWRSFEHLEAFARDQDDPHLEPWRNYWRRVGRSDRTGIWHETFLVRAGEWEAVYGNMPPIGLGKATTLIPSRSRARRVCGSGRERPARLRSTGSRPRRSGRRAGRPFSAPRHPPLRYGSAARQPCSANAMARSPSSASPTSPASATSASKASCHAAQ